MPYKYNIITITLLHGEVIHCIFFKETISKRLRRTGILAFILLLAYCDQVYFLQKVCDILDKTDLGMIITSTK